jgi:hypothetical protein
LQNGGLEEIPQNPDVTMNMACIATEVLSKRHVKGVDEIGCGCFSISQFIIPLACPFVLLFQKLPLV